MNVRKIRFVILFFFWNIKGKSIDQLLQSMNFLIKYLALGPGHDEQWSALIYNIVSSSDVLASLSEVYKWDKGGAFNNLLINCLK